MVAEQKLVAEERNRGRGGEHSGKKLREMKTLGLKAAQQPAVKLTRTRGLMTA